MGKYGEVDILVNNAGVIQGKSILELNEEHASRTMVINLESHFWLIREFLPAMLRKNEGHIVGVASMAGLAGAPYLTDYCASKFGCVGLMEALRIEMKSA